MIESVLHKMIEYFGQDVKRINHAIKVFGFGYSIAEREKLYPNKILIVKIASILHDIGIKEAERKFNSSSGYYQELEGPEIAKKLLSSIDLDADTLERILFLIGNHHSYNKIDGIDFQILIEADFIVNIFEEKISQKNIENIKKKYFKTKTGIKILKSMYCANNT